MSTRRRVLIARVARALRERAQLAVTSRVRSTRSEHARPCILRAPAARTPGTRIPSFRPETVLRTRVPSARSGR
eukprot:7154274-Lingulodinium_polyedra.AAC.1